MDQLRTAKREERVHGGHVECPSGLASHLIQMEDALETPMQKEEEVVFPMLARGMNGIANQPVELENNVLFADLTETALAGLIVIKW
ncbi:hypothetical protein [Halospina denitrificans]|uniref:hypothetical protein n=1 Tax=Halospina denitrificans TaxID=332522 RepID=UPI0010620887|nr:hypothetical protein [Halospina denitrificans]